MATDREGHCCSESANVMSALDLIAWRSVVRMSGEAMAAVQSLDS